METDRDQDPTALRALAHPLRWKLIDLLGEEGSATATRCAEVLGQSVASCSYHLNILAKYGYVTEATGGAGRQKPWRLTSTEQVLGRVGPDPDSALAAEAVTEVFLDHENARLKENLRSQAPQEWQDATTLRGLTAVLTVDELRELGTQIERLFSRYTDRLANPDARPHDGRWVRLFFASSLIPPRPTPPAAAAPEAPSSAPKAASSGVAPSSGGASEAALSAVALSTAVSRVAVSRAVPPGL